MSIRQREDEMLRSYIVLLNKETLSINEADDKILVTAFMNGLQKGKLNGDPSKRSRDKYCLFHQDHGHNTSECYDLKQRIETLIRQGKLQKFLNKEGTE